MDTLERMSLKLELRRLLTAAARARETRRYADLAAEARVPAPHRIHTLTGLLEEMMAEDQAAGRPLLAALVVSRRADALPAPGFFQHLRALGRYAGPDRGAAAQAAHCAELEAAWDWWGRDAAAP